MTVGQKESLPIKTQEYLMKRDNIFEIFRPLFLLTSKVKASVSVRLQKCAQNAWADVENWYCIVRNGL
jgi:hypothetical protein